MLSRSSKITPFTDISDEAYEYLNSLIDDILDDSIYGEITGDLITIPQNNDKIFYNLGNKYTIYSYNAKKTNVNDWKELFKKARLGFLVNGEYHTFPQDNKINVLIQKLSGTTSTNDNSSPPKTSCFNCFKSKNKYL